MPAESYADGMSYETFIYRAHKCDRGTRNGADVSFVRNLIDKEKGETWVKHLPKFEKLLDEVKKYMLKAIDKYLTRKPTEKERNELLQLRDEVEAAYSSSEIVNLVDRGLKITQRYRDI